MTLRSLLLATSLMFSCGASAPTEDAGEADAGTTQDAGEADAGTPDAGAQTPALTSTALTEGGTFPTRYTCTDTTTRGRVSLPLAWTAISGAQSYALVMTDTSINLIHWIIWDLPAATRELPEGIANLAQPPMPAGAKQTTSYDGTTFGYRGPCPPTPHVYRFELTGLDVPTLPGVTTASTRQQVQAAIAAHALGTAALSGSYGP